MKKAYLALADGRVFEGESFGAETDCVGELIFNTGVIGCAEALTDPCYAGQIILNTFPLAGNYGVIDEDIPEEVYAVGFIARECCEEPSNFRCNRSLDGYLRDKGIPGIGNIDTRCLTSVIREEGSMNAAIVHSLPADIDAIKAFKRPSAQELFFDKKPRHRFADGHAEHSVVIIDCGAADAIAAVLSEKGCECEILPGRFNDYQTYFSQYDGVVFSDGPGDPAENPELVALAAKLFGCKPLFGVGLGHEIIALSQGGKVEKLPHGHHGANHPVKKNGSARTYVTSQNHNYTVLPSSLEGAAKEIYTNLNDMSCEGLEYPGKKCLTVEFSPAGCALPGEKDTPTDVFLAMLRGCEDA